MGDWSKIEQFNIAQVCEILGVSDDPNPVQTLFPAGGVSHGGNYGRDDLLAIAARKRLIEKGVYFGVAYRVVRWNPPQWSDDGPRYIGVAFHVDSDGKEAAAPIALDNWAEYASVVDDVFPTEVPDIRPDSIIMVNLRELRRWVESRLELLDPATCPGSNVRPLRT